MKLLLLCFSCYTGSLLAEMVSFEETKGEVSGGFIYDPLTGRSHANKGSLLLVQGEEKSLPLGEVNAGKSFTIQAFVKPLSGEVGSLVALGRELCLAMVRVAGTQVWCGGTVKGKDHPIGHYVSSSRYDPMEPRWRHLAAVYDAEALRVTLWLDYHLSTQVKLDEPLKLETQALKLGGEKCHALLDEVSWHSAVLTPADFLRARSEPLEAVSFHTAETVLPRASGALDARYHFGAVGDGKADDTAALNAAFEHLANKVPLAYNTLVIPEGTYLVSDMLYCSRFIDVKGAGSKKTRILLKDGVFTDATKPKPILRMSSTRGDPGSHKGVNGSSISLYLSGVTLDIGKGNRGAKALEYHSNNLGTLEDVVLLDRQSEGVVGLDLTHHDCGPCLIKNVEVHGFQVGVTTKYQEYSLTFEHLKLRGQMEAGIVNRGNILAIRGLDYDGFVPAIQSYGANSMVVVLDSQISAVKGHGGGIEAEGGLYALRTKVSGFPFAIVKKVLVNQKPMEWRTEEHDVLGEEFIGDSITLGHGSAKGALKLAIEETPVAPEVPLKSWRSVLDYAHLVKDEDWAPAIQAACDSQTAVLYLPRGHNYTCKSAVRLHGVQRIIGMRNALHWHKTVWQEKDKREQTDAASAPPPLLIFDEPDATKTLWLERCMVDHIHHASPATLVLKSSSPERYSNGAGCGKLFMEDIGAADWHFDHPQQVWVRQWNPESHRAGPCIHSKGATIWSLGFKTEYESQKVLAEAGAKTELLGGFIYPLGKIPADRPAFENKDSALSLIYGMSIYAANHKVHIRDSKAGQVKELSNEGYRWAGSRARMDLYSSE